jgi:hypothetical protein
MRRRFVITKSDSRCSIVGRAPSQPLSPSRSMLPQRLNRNFGSVITGSDRNCSRVTGDSDLAVAALL